MVVGFIQVPVGTIKDWLREQRYPLTNGILRPAHGNHPLLYVLQYWNEAARANSFAGQRPRFLVYREACQGGPAKEWPEAVGILARGRARGIFPGPVNVALLALELVSPSRSLPVDSLSRSSEDGSRAPMLKSTGVGMKPMT